MKKSSLKKKYNSRFVKAERSQLFRLLYTAMYIEDEYIPILTFRNDGSGCYTCKELNNCKIMFENYEFNGYKGVLLRVYDNYEKEIITSKNLKINYTGYKRNGYEWITDKPREYNVKDKDRIFPSPYYYDYISATFSCQFKACSQPKNYDFDILAVDDGFQRIKQFSLGYGICTCSISSLRKSQLKEYKEVFEVEHKKLWGEKLNLIKSPYFNIFSNNN